MFSTPPNESASVQSRAFSSLPIRAFVACSLVLIAGSAVAASDDEELDRWVPSVALEVGGFGHTGKGNIDGTMVVGPRADIGPTQATINGDFSDDRLTNPLASREEIASMIIGGNFEIMSPRLIDAPSHPRMFMDVSVFATNTAEVKLARDANPGVMAVPPEARGRLVGDGSILGRGSQISVQHKDPQVYVGIGVALTVPMPRGKLRVKPSFTYSRIPVDVATTTRRAIRQRPANDPGNPFEIDDPGDYRLLIFDDYREEVYHGAGVALELDYGTGEYWGPFEVGLYLKGGAARLFGDLKTEVTSSNPAYPAEQIFYKYSQDRWVARMSVGFRLRLVKGLGELTKNRR